MGTITDIPFRPVYWDHVFVGRDVLDLTDGRGAMQPGPVTMMPSSFTRMLYGTLPSKLDRRSVLEVGTGGGGLLIAAKKFLGAGRCVGTDIDPDALIVAHQNAQKNEAVGIEWRQGSMFDAVGQDQFDLIVCNPSSMPDALLAPAHAVVHRQGGVDGRCMIENLAVDSIRYLNPGGEIRFVLAGICDVERTIVEMAHAGLIDVSVLHAELFQLTPRFTPDIEARRRWIQHSGLSDGLICLNNGDWLEMRYVIRGARPPDDHFKLFREEVRVTERALALLRHRRAEAYEAARVSPMYQPDPGYTVRAIRAC